MKVIRSLLVIALTTIASFVQANTDPGDAYLARSKRHRLYGGSDTQYSARFSQSEGSSWIQEFTLPNGNVFKRRMDLSPSGMTIEDPKGRIWHEPVNYTWKEYDDIYGEPAIFYRSIVGVPFSEAKEHCPKRLSVIPQKEDFEDLIQMTDGNLAEIFPEFGWKGSPYLPKGYYWTATLVDLSEKFPEMKGKIVYTLNADDLGFGFGEIIKRKHFAADLKYLRCLTHPQ